MRLLPADGDGDVTQGQAMNVRRVLAAKLDEAGGRAQVPLLRGGSFSAQRVADGIEVDNLHGQPLLTWAAFEEAVRCMERQGGRAQRGDAMQSRLGDPDLSLDSVEGHVAAVVYGREPGDSVFRRITPIACLLIWASICEAAPGELVLRTQRTSES